MRTVHIATLPERKESLLRTIASLYHQSDRVYVMLNGYGYNPHIPDPEGKVTKIPQNNQYGDAAKVLNLNDREGYVFLCDDDLSYPLSYCDYMIAKHKQYSPALITLHGRIYKRPVYKSHGGYLASYHCRKDVTGDHRVDVGGTGVMLLHTSEFNITMDDCPKKNMLDIWVARQSHKLNLPIIVVEHKADFLKYTHHRDNIWNNHMVKDEQYQVEILKSFLKK